MMAKEKLGSSRILSMARMLSYTYPPRLVYQSLRPVRGKAVPIKPKKNIRVTQDWNEWYTFFFFEDEDDNPNPHSREVPADLWKAHQKAEKSWGAAREKLKAYFEVE